MFGLKRLRRENAALRDALGWYATSANWRKRGTNPPGQPRTWIKSPAAFDRGARAKFILTQLASLNVGVHTPPFLFTTPAEPQAVDTSDTE